MVELAYLSLKKTTFFVHIFDISHCVFTQISIERSLDAEFDSASNEYPHCILLMDLATQKTRNTWKNVMMTSSSHLSGFLVFGIAGSVKSMQCGYSLDAESNSASNELSWLTYFIEILLVLEFQLTKTYFGMFSYKSHFRPQISSNGRLYNFIC